MIYYIKLTLQSLGLPYILVTCMKCEVSININNINYDDVCLNKYNVKIG